MKKDKGYTSLALNITKGALTATAWIFEFLISAGLMTAEAFLNPSYYGEMPSVSLDDLLAPQKKSKKKKFTEMAIRHSLWRLQKQGFVKKEGGLYGFTEKGRHLARYVLGIKKVTEKKWDGKYRVVVFDIPEKQAHFRNWLRQELRILNYKKLQESVFVSKHPLTPDLIKEIKKSKMGNGINYLLVDKIYKNIV